MYNCLLIVATIRVEPSVFFAFISKTVNNQCYNPYMFGKISNSYRGDYTTISLRQSSLENSNMLGPGIELAELHCASMMHVKEPLILLAVKISAYIQYIM